MRCPMDHQFRNSAIGGFHKQDVLDYLEQMAQNHRNQLQSVQDELNQVQEQRRLMLEEESDLKSQVAQMKQENQKYMQATAHAQEKLEECQAANENLRKQLAESEETRCQLMSLVEKLRPAAEAYQAIKERSAGVELDAHRRAQGVLDQARADANHLQSQVGQWLKRVEEDYADMRRQIDAAVQQAGREMEKVTAHLNTISQQLGEQDSAFSGLEKAYSQYPLTKDKVPAPMPIPEEE